jgi:hypothetical protein
VLKLGVVAEVLGALYGFLDLVAFIVISALDGPCRQRLMRGVNCFRSLRGTAE